MLTLEDLVFDSDVPANSHFCVHKIIFTSNLEPIKEILRSDNLQLLDASNFILNFLNENVPFRSSQITDVMLKKQRIVSDFAIK